MEERYKKRAAIACQTCRTRKVRCDITVRGSPCTNCQLDQKVCELPRKRLKLQRRSDEKAPFGREHDRLKKAVTTRRVDFDRLLTSQTAFDVSYSSQKPQTSGESDADENSDLAESSPSSKQNQDDRRELRSSPTCKSIHAFVQENNEFINQQTLLLLEKHQVFTLPSITLQIELVEKYVEKVHPFLQIIELEALLAGNYTDVREKSISLVLLYAVLSTAVPFVSDASLSQDGYTTKQEAQVVFVQRARLLHKYQYDTDPIVQIQTLVHLSWCCVGDQTLCGTDELLCEALDIFRQERARYAEAKTDVPGSATLWKRIWWSLYLNDWFAALGRRAPVGDNSEFAMPSLKSNDLNARIEPHDSAHKQFDSRQTAEMYIALIELSKLGHYETQQPVVDEISTILTCDENLRIWEKTLSRRLRFRSVRDFPSTAQIKLDPFGTYRVLIHIAYLATLCSLHHCQGRQAFRKYALFADTDNPSTTTSRDTAEELLDILLDEHVQDLFHVTPKLVVNVLMIIVRVLLSGLGVDENHRSTCSRLRECMFLLRSMIRHFNPAEAALSAVCAVFQGIRAPRRGYAKSPLCAETWNLSTSGVVNMIDTSSIHPGTMKALSDENLSRRSMSFMSQQLSCASTQTADSNEQSPLGISMPYWSRDTSPCSDLELLDLPMRHSKPVLSMTDEWTNPLEEYFDFELGQSVPIHDNAVRV